MGDNEDLEKDPVDAEDETEEATELPKEPVDKNESIEVQVQTRAEKKRNRFKEVEERATRAERAAEEARRDAAEARATYQRQLQHPQAPQQQEHPAATKLRDLDNMEDRLHQEYEIVASKPGYDRNGPQEKEYRRQARNIQVARMAAVQQASQQPINEQELMRKMAWQQFTSEHSDVFTDQKAQAWAIGRWQQLVHGEGKADTRQLAEEILDDARIKFGKQPRNGRGSRPDEATRRRLSGVSAQASGAGGPTTKVSMSNMERQMARVKYDDLPPEKAYQKWANNEGKRAAEKMAARK